MQAILEIRYTRYRQEDYKFNDMEDIYFSYHSARYTSAVSAHGDECGV